MKISRKGVLIMKSKVLVNLGLFIAIAMSSTLTNKSPQVLAQNLPPPDIASGMYVSSGHIYYWNNEAKTTCHIVNPAQHKIFMARGVPNRNGNFYPYNYKESCLWPQGVYEPPGEGKAFFITSRGEICHIPTSALQVMLVNQYGVDRNNPYSVISAGLKNIGICPTPE